MKLKSVVAAVALVAAGANAMAADIPLGPLSATPSVLGPSLVSGLFSLGYSFSLSALSDVGGGAAVFAPSSFTAVTISNGSSTFSDINAADGFSFSGLGAGSYTLSVWGYSPGVPAMLVGAIAATPVPEPETYAMLLAGLGALGFLARRRSNA